VKDPSLIQQRRQLELSTPHQTVSGGCDYEKTIVEQPFSPDVIFDQGLRQSPYQKVDATLPQPAELHHQWLGRDHMSRDLRMSLRHLIDDGRNHAGQCLGASNTNFASSRLLKKPPDKSLRI
jgi:hypothetical protein